MRSCDSLKTLISDVTVAFGLVLTTVVAASAQEAPCVIPRMDQVKAHIRAKLTQSAQGLNYHYLVENQLGAPQVLESFAIQALIDSGRLLTQMSHPDWEARGKIADTSFYSWVMFKEPRGLPAGTAASGFGFTNTDLPTIATFLAWNDVEPPSFPEGEAPEFCEGENVLENSFKGITIGPKLPPKPFVPIEFLNYVITLLHDSRQLGWVRESEEHQKLLKTLLKAKRRLEANEPAKAANGLRKFLKSVKKEGCPDFRCPKSKALTSEAYALFYFNGQFLLDRLPKPPHEREDDGHDDDKDD